MSTTFFVSVLLITTFAANGLLGIWAATSSRSWPTRAVAILCVLSPLVVAGALEPFVVLLLQSAVIAGCLGASRVAKRVLTLNEGGTRLQRLRAESRVSMSALLSFVGLIAILFAVGIYLPTLSRLAWQSMILIGFCMGLSSAFPALLGQSLSMRMLIPVCTLLAVIVAAPLAWLDWLIPSFVGWAGWPPEPYYAGFLGIGVEERPITAWFYISVGVSLLLVGFVRRLGTPTPQRLAPRLVATLLLGVVPLYFLWVVLRPSVHPTTPDTESNAFEEIEKLSNSIATSRFETIEIDWDLCSKAKLESVLPEIEDQLESLSPLLLTRAHVVVDYESEYLPDERNMDFRSTQQALGARARLAILDGDRERAVASLLDAVRLGFVLRREGLLVDALVGIACSVGGSRGLYLYREKFSAIQSMQAAEAVLQLQENADGYEPFRLRDRAWVQSATGWHGRVTRALYDFSGESRLYSDDDLRNQFLLEEAVMRLVATELALNAFFSENERWPSELSELVPRYLASVPIDPFSADGGILRYERANDEYVLYSVGANGLDEGGVPPTGFVPLFGAPGSGDVSLDAYFEVDQSLE